MYNLKEKNNFVKWFIVFFGSLTGLFIANQYELLNLVFQNDVSCISSLILFLYLVASLMMGRISQKVDESYHLYEQEKQLNVVKFINEHFTVLGLLGTIFGFCACLYGSLNESLDIQTVINQLKVGSSTALYTTACGLIATLLLSIQIFILENNK